MNDKVFTDSDFLKETGDAEKFGIIEEEEKKNRKIKKGQKKKIHAPKMT